MSVQNSILNSYYRSAASVALLENDPKVIEYLQAVKERDSARRQTIEEMAKQKIVKTSGKTTVREYRFGEMVVEMKTTSVHFEPQAARDVEKNSLSIK